MFNTWIGNEADIRLNYGIPNFHPSTRNKKIGLVVVFIKMPSRQQQRRAKRRAEYLQNRNEELETSLGFGASKRGRVCCDEQNSDELRASKRQKQQETNRDSKRIQYWINPSAACLAKRAQYQKRKREAQR